MFTVRYGGKGGPTVQLVDSPNHLVVRTEHREALKRAPVSRETRQVLGEFRTVTSFPRAGVELLEAITERGGRGLRDRARTLLKKEPAIRFAGRALEDKDSKEPVSYTENFFIKFHDDESASSCLNLLKKHKLAVRRQLPFARNAFFIAAPEGTGQEIFAVATRLLGEPAVALCHPEIIRRAARRVALPGQWHLKKMKVNGSTIDQHASVEAAWALAKGEGATIAIIDDGVDIDHEEFSSPGKVVAPRDATFEDDDPRPGSDDDHGTACAGVAAADGRFGASGVAPAARLMPIRLVSDLGSMQEADAFQWAVDHGADVISCSWGPVDGKWSWPGDPKHKAKAPLPDSTRLAIEYALAQGRNGRGCVITWAAGNGNESVDNDGYASHPDVIAVAACNDSGKKSAYSDFGKAVWCAFPSNDTIPANTPGILTTDRTGAAGYNQGLAELGDEDGDYTNDFGGTSSACPGVAGVAALILARNPNLRHDEVKDIIRHSCDKIDKTNGKYDTDGRSPLYGYGRVNALKAVQLAQPAQPSPVAIRSTVQDVPIRDLKTSKLAIAVADTKALTSLKVGVDIEHTYIGDLIVSIKPPAASGVGAIVLHNRIGGGSNNIKKTYDTVSTPALQALIGKKPAGTWTLVVQDKERADTGKIRSVTLELGL
jgi:subtilisin family serine protease